MNTLCKISQSFNIKPLLTGPYESLASIIQENVTLAPKTTFKVGGCARFFACPRSKDELLLLLKFCRENSMEHFILGGGSNLVVSDSGICKMVISTEKLNHISFSCADGLSVFCESGVTIKMLTEFCCENAISGFENFAGLPGSVGGALYMNARCYSSSFSDNLESVTYISRDLHEKVYQFNKSDWAYKCSPFQTCKDEYICITGATFSKNLCMGIQADIRKACEEKVLDRENKGHFKFPSAGSVFKNNHDFGKPSGQIIDEAGLKGLQIGGAKVADFHGNIIINVGNATATDIAQLVSKVKDEVYKKTGFSLECEIIFTENL